MSLYLQPDVELEFRDRSVLLRRRQVDVEHVLGVAEAIALSCLAVTGEYNSASAICSESLPDGATWMRRTVDRYRTYLGDGESRPLDSAWFNRLSEVRPTFPILPMSNIKQEAAPASITWMVTLGCNRKCPYCFFNVFHRSAAETLNPPDATFPLPDAIRMVREMAQIGAADLYLTGGEPFLRRDLLEVIAAASDVHVRTHAVTKYPMSKGFARDLAGAGIASITVSIDDSREKIADALAGAPGYLKEAIATVEALLDAGVDVDVNSVVTKINSDRLSDLAALVKQLGVPRLKLSPFHSPYPRRAPAENLLTGFDLHGELQRLQASASLDGLEIVLGEGADGGAQRDCSSSFVCEIGTKALDVLPDGSVSRCHYLPGLPTMVVGNLQSHTLMEVWTGSAIKSLSRPEREQFEGTSCSSCSGHDGCNSRGRCYVSALQGQGRLHAPDAFCSQVS
jgi:pyrroloquinoline quinone biosynthesis protein E